MSQPQTNKHIDNLVLLDMKMEVDLMIDSFEGGDLSAASLPDLDEFRDKLHTLAGHTDIAIREKKEVIWCDMDERWYYKHDERWCSCTPAHGCTFFGIHGLRAQDAEPIGEDLFKRQRELEL